MGPKATPKTKPRGKKDDEANYTTIMLRNIPNKRPLLTCPLRRCQAALLRYSRQMLIDQPRGDKPKRVGSHVIATELALLRLHSAGFTGLIDYLYGSPDSSRSSRSCGCISAVKSSPQPTRQVLVTGNHGSSLSLGAQRPVK